jgi:DNA-binding Lrp family transcriptional regulator
MSEGFAAVPNWMIRDQRFTRKSILVYISLASRSGPGGIYPSQATIATEMGLSERTVRAALKELEQLGVIERIRRRASEGKSTTLTTGYMLHPNGTVGSELPAMVAAGLELPANSDEATGKIEQVTPSIEEEPVKKKAATPKRASRINPDFKLDESMLEWARAKAPSVSIETETENFVDYWTARPGAGGVKLDWPATWRTWMRRSHERGVERGWTPQREVPQGQEWLNR